ncbi:hypothetical protein HZS_2487 [Henneguya salminicola]|nr:hypothetical protein HZS_2487 [Henneguya salminicola]
MTVTATFTVLACRFLTSPHLGIGKILCFDSKIGQKNYSKKCNFNSKIQIKKRELLMAQIG